MSIENSFKGKRVLVTGVGQGIGKAIAVQLYKYGAYVIGVSKNEERLKELKNECPDLETIQVDLADWNATKKAIDALDCVDCLVNNAGVSITEGILDITPEGFDTTFNINVKAAVNVCQSVARKMKDAGKGGSIVLISSVLSQKVVPYSSVYCATKAALDSFGRSMALELGKYKIRVNMINNACVPTSLLASGFKTMQEIPKSENEIVITLAERTRYPLGEVLIDVDEVVTLTLFVLSDLTSMITGQTHVMDGGFLVT